MSLGRKSQDVRDLCLPQPLDPQDQGRGHRTAHQGRDVHPDNDHCNIHDILHFDAGTKTIGIPWI